MLQDELPVVLVQSDFYHKNDVDVQYMRNLRAVGLKTFIYGIDSTILQVTAPLFQIRGQHSLVTATLVR